MKKVIIITGAASGIGKAMTTTLLQQGHLIAALDINEQKVREAQKEESWPHDQVFIHSLDIREVKEWEQVLSQILSQWSKVDILMNIAGYMRPGEISQTPLEEIDLHFDINVKGTILGSKVVSSIMLKQGSGHIINVGSLSGVTPIKGISLYSSSKFAVRGFTLSLAQELRPKGLDVSLVSPDAVETPMLELQRNYKEAALTFSGVRPLRLPEVINHLLMVIEKRPIETNLPFYRGFLAKVTNFFPFLLFWFDPIFTKIGLKNQSK